VRDSKEVGAMRELAGKKVLAVVGPRFQDQEALVPIRFLRERGAEVTVAGIEVMTIQAIHGATLEVDKTIEEVDPADFDALLVPGGKSPAYLREYPAVLDFVRRFSETGRPIAAICHGGQLLAAAGLVKGLRMTGWPGIRAEMEEAGALFVDEPVVVDRNVITSRYPEDLEAFDSTLEELLAA
jgi:protease I